MTSTTDSTDGPWRPGKLLAFLMAWTAVTCMIFWLPTVRGLMDGPGYEWANFWFSGAGTGGDYWFPVTGSVLTLTAFWLGWRGARFPFHLLLVGWHGLLAAGAVWLATTHPEAFRFRGDTLGVDVSLAWAGPVLFGGVALLAVFWTVRDLVRRRREPELRVLPPWSRTNTMLLILAAALVPFQFVLLRSGPIHGLTDQIGVVLTLAQWGVLAAAFYPFASSGASEARRA